MKKNRYILCLLAAGLMLYYALPNLSIHADGVSGYFAISWIILCLFVIAGNLSALLYSPKSVKSYRPGSNSRQKKLRSYH
ncbi:hypothetical protein [Bacillus dakarensis]|uniref:hypothetical protein n=1 Tax=Robertmurraya dakarensis TaxID=1926278 RepID=UPI0009820BAC|nr:hypothetical protein [Bacillus dakarensis]